MGRGLDRGLQDVSPDVWNACIASRHRVPSITQPPCQHDGPPEYF
ncbi:hypothetical protein BURCENBC7_AP1647 [Burkholderia cenocepacia BC7]|nr:hypothetical protein BURCENK562V_C4741 [Burkholderia cenocepacia K56-2Valvano]ERI31751.1 hypothetical protein BURCENBC7_AP1647 [Burkholderia cenocepacia BC7]